MAIIERNKQAKLVSPPPAWEQSLEQLRGDVQGTLTEIQDSFYKMQESLSEEARRAGREEVQRASRPFDVTEQARIISELCKAVQEIANDLDTELLTLRGMKRK